jgi:8-oxo-dGTP pyrophosphatase MutT (NUDIX family)
MATDWSDPLVISGIAGAVLVAAATVWAMLRAARKDAPQSPAPAAKPAVAVGIVQKGNAVILVRRIKPEQGVLWQFPAGIHNPKRSEAESVVHEVLEETGVKRRVVRELGRRVHPATGAALVYFHCAYESGELQNDDPQEDDPQENAEVKWTRADEVKSLLTSDVFPEVANLPSTIDV